MNQRERFRETLLFGQPDRIPLMPGAPRMANFPIPLISRRKPYRGSLIPRPASRWRTPGPRWVPTPGMLVSERNV